MRCHECGFEAVVLKTVRLRKDDYKQQFAVCNGCWLPIRELVWIIPGPVAWGKCLSCGEWPSLRDLVDVKPGAAGRGDAPGGTCVVCENEGRR